MAAEPGKPDSLFEYVYLLHEREFLNSGRQLYKIGRTAQSPNDRFDGYPKGSCVVFYLRVPDSKATEKAIKAFQLETGLSPDGLPNQNLLKSLRR